MTARVGRNNSTHQSRTMTFLQLDENLVKMVPLLLDLVELICPSIRFSADGHCLGKFDHSKLAVK